MAPILAPLVQVWFPVYFFKFYLYWMLDIVASYHCMQFQGKIMNQIWGNGKKPSFGPNFGPSGPNLGQQILVSYRHVQYQKKLMIQAWENVVTDEGTNEQTDERTDEQTDESDLTGRCPTNVERPTKTNKKKKQKTQTLIQHVITL